MASHLAKKNIQVHKERNKRAVELWKKTWKARQRKALEALGEQVWNKRHNEGQVKYVWAYNNEAFIQIRSYNFEGIWGEGLYQVLVECNNDEKSDVSGMRF